MDELLRRRYEALIEFTEPPYPYVGINAFVGLLRPLVDSAVAAHKIVLRPDATYFLLVNLSEMILRPYAADIPTPPVWWSRGEAPGTLPQYRDFKPDTTIVRIETALNIILGDIQGETDPEGVSAHQVIRAIDRNWKKLSVSFAWG